MNVLIIGGTGFIGSHLVNKISKDGHDISILSKNGIIPGNLLNASFKMIKGDFGDDLILDQVLIGIDIVIHLAWTSVPSQEIKEIELDVLHNINGTISLLNKCVTHQIKKFIFISSGGTVYGVPKEIPIKEDHSLNPISSYGVSKVSIEKYLHLYNKLFGLDYLVFRVSNAYGEYQNLTKGQGVLGIWLDNIFSGKEIAIWGDGNIIRDYIHITDIVEVISYAINHSFADRIYNLGSGQGVSLNEIILMIKENITENFKVGYYHGREIDVPVNILDIHKLENEINYSPTVSLIEGLVNVWGWINKNRSLSILKTRI